MIDCNCACVRVVSLQPFTYKPKDVTVELWEPIRKKVSKCCPKTLPKPCSVVTEPEVSCEVIICDRALNQMLFKWIIYSCGCSHMITLNKPMIVGIWSAMVSSTKCHHMWPSPQPNVLGLPPGGGFLKIVQVTMKHDPFDAVKESMWTLPSIFVHSHSYSVAPSSVVWRALGPAPPLSTMRVVEVYGHGLSILCVKWAWRKLNTNGDTNLSHQLAQCSELPQCNNVLLVSSFNFHERMFKRLFGLYST